jgi:hypothetical protein
MTEIGFASDMLRRVVENDEMLTKAASLASEDVVCTVAAKTISGLSVQSFRGRITDENYNQFKLVPKAADNVASRLEKLGFRIINVGRFSITISGPAALYREVLKTEMAIHAVPRSTTRGLRMLAWAPAIPRPEQLFAGPLANLSVPARRVNDLAEHFVFIPPPIYAQVGTAPSPAYWHLTLDDVRRVLKADGLKDTGNGCTVEIIDSGFYLAHPHFKNLRSQTFSVEAGTAGTDAIGHGTMVLANALAIAPAADYILVKFVPAMASAALDIAIEKAPRILNCSWGWPNEQSFPTIEAAIKSAVLDDGITVFFAAGNGEAHWPASMPEVIAVGGVSIDAKAQLSASSFASGFASNLYPPRVVPDLSGLVGSAPQGVLIVLPTEPGSEMDRQLGGSTFPDGDGTSTSDGWVVASGTSSATPQLAGIAALMIEKNPALKPADVKRILTNTATPVTTGTNALGITATAHPNVAVGYGLAKPAWRFKMPEQSGLDSFDKM